jgi:restriction system protein
VLPVCWIAALFSFLGARHRRRLLDTRTTLESIAAGGWRQFEFLVGEAFRRLGYSVEVAGLGSAEGGIKLVLRKDGHRTLVQRKQSKRQQVGVSVVREMYGLLAHHQANAVKIVCIGSHTQDAAWFPQRKPIELIDGEMLLEMIRATQSSRVTESPLRQEIESAYLLRLTLELDHLLPADDVGARLYDIPVAAQAKLSLAAVNSHTAAELDPNFRITEGKFCKLSPSPFS